MDFPYLVVEMIITVVRKKVAQTLVEEPVAGLYIKTSLHGLMDYI